jgi:hypothetical protein
MSHPKDKAIFSLGRAVSGTLVIIGLVFAYLERRYAPNTIVLENSPDLPGWVGWLGRLPVLIGGSSGI